MQGVSTISDAILGKSKRSSGYHSLFDAPSPDSSMPLHDEGAVVKLGLRNNLYCRMVDKGLQTDISQFLGILRPGILKAVHLFRDLKRGCYFDGDMGSSRDVYIYTWKPQYDCERNWERGAGFGCLLRHPAPNKKVFVVLVRKLDGGDVFGTVERWNWVEEDTRLPGAPKEYDIRYGKVIWSKHHD